MNRLQPTERLNVNDALESDNGLVRLALEGNGNLVLYRQHFRQALWASNTVGSGVTSIVMRPDGNLVGLSAAGVTSWETATSGNPGAAALVQDDGNFVIVDTANVTRWQSNTKPDFTAPAIQYVDANGYEYVETSEWLKNAVSGIPCCLAMQWPGYATAIVEDRINGEDVVIQLWKGWCPQFFANFPGGFGAEVGVYRRVLGRIAPRGFPSPSTIARGAALAAGTVVNTMNENFWWPFPELKAEISYTLINPVTNQTFYTAGLEVTYWLAKWMSVGSYSQYQQDQGPRWPGLPSAFPGNSRTPLNPTDYRLDYVINGKSYPRW